MSKTIGIILNFSSDQNEQVNAVLVSLFENSPAVIERVRMFAGKIVSGDEKDELMGEFITMTYPDSWKEQVEEKILLIRADLNSKLVLPIKASVYYLDY